MNVNKSIRGLLFIGYVLTCFGTYSCKYECWGFPNEDLSWIPYEIGDTISYHSENESMDFVVDDFFKTAPDSYRGFAMDYECYYEGYYSTMTNEQNYKLKESFSTNHNDGMKVVLTENDLFYFQLWKEKTSTDTLEVVYHTDTIIESVKYSDVFVVNKKILKSGQRISWIIKAKDKGIIQFYDREIDKIWTIK